VREGGLLVFVCVVRERVSGCMGGCVCARAHSCRHIKRTTPYERERARERERESESESEMETWWPVSSVTFWTRPLPMYLHTDTHTHLILYIIIRHKMSGWSGSRVRI
jgi:hypothetical protein